MKREKLKGKVQTVLGIIDGADLGVTSPHEHLLIDLSCVFTEPGAASEKLLAYQPVTLENLSWVKHNSWHSLDCLRLQDVQLAINEAMLFRQAGGNTIVDASSIGLGRDPVALVRIAQATGLNIIMGAGYYTEASCSEEFGMKSEEEIAEEIVHDITEGVGADRVRAGFIGEIGNSWPWTEGERKLMRAAVSAQRRTGAALMVHPGFNPSAPFEIIEALREEEADLSHTIMCHTEATLTNFEQRRRLAETGCYLEFDTFGREGYFDLGPSEDFIDAPPWVAALTTPNDLQRIDQIIELIAAGYVNQILIAQDVCKKINLVHYGGPGYSHILRHIVPLARLKGISDEHIHILLVENPKRAFPFA